MKSPRAAPSLRVVPLTPARWRDFEALFGEKGACNGCWCMAPRLGIAYVRTKGERNKRAMKALVDAGKEPGLLAYRGRTPVGWIALGAREEYPALARSRVAKSPDGAPAWIVQCFFVAKEARGCGVTVALLRAAAAHAKKRGATLLEGVPNDVASDAPPVFVWQGLASSFSAAGFTEIARRSARRPYMRLELKQRRRGSS